MDDRSVAVVTCVSLDRRDPLDGESDQQWFQNLAKKKGQASFSRCEAFFIHFWAHPLTLLLIGGLC